MAQTAEGAIKVAAGRIGLAAEEYTRLLAAGQKFCTGCKAWHSRVAFTRDASRTDGLAARCIDSMQRHARSKYQPRQRLPLGRRFVAARDGDKEQARGRVNSLVRVGLLPDPDTLLCADCGHCAGSDGRRHEYDHHLGYAAEHHEHVEAVCSRCHHRRERGR